MWQCVTCHMTKVWTLRKQHFPVTRWSFDSSGICTSNASLTVPFTKLVRTVSAVFGYGPLYWKHVTSKKIYTFAIICIYLHTCDLGHLKNVNFMREVFSEQSRCFMSTLHADAPAIGGGRTSLSRSIPNMTGVFPSSHQAPSRLLQISSQMPGEVFLMRRGSEQRCNVSVS